MKTATASIVLLIIATAWAEVSINTAQGGPAIRLVEMGNMQVLKEHFVIRISSNMTAIVQACLSVQKMVDSVDVELCDDRKECRAIFENVKRIQEKLYSELEQIVQCETKPRSKRAVFEGFGHMLKWFGGSMDSEDSASINRNLKDLNTDMDNLNRFVNSTKSIQVDAMTNIQQILAHIDTSQKSVMQHERADQKIKFLQTKAAQLSNEIEGLKLMQRSGKLSTSIVSINTLKDIFEKKRKSLAQMEAIPYKNAIQWVSNQEVSMNIQNGTLFIDIELPIVDSKQYRIYNIKLLPVIRNATMTMITAKTTAAAVSTEDHILFEDMSRCKKIRREYICDVSAIPIKLNGIENSCIESALMQHKINLEGCSERTITVKIKATSIVTIDENEAMLISNGTETDMKITCMGLTTRKKTPDSVYIKSFQGCQIEINGEITLKSTYRTKSTAESYVEIIDGDWTNETKNGKDTPDFVGDKLMTIQALTQELNAIQPMAQSHADARFVRMWLEMLMDNMYLIIAVAIIIIIILAGTKIKIIYD